jgi:malate dehydrogenase (oxaloacetate-decarboxylating)(NADP+)
MVAEGTKEADARQSCYLVDSKGLVCASRGAELQHHKRPYAHDVAFVATLADAVEALKPTALIGVSATPATFTSAIIARMAQ